MDTGEYLYFLRATDSAGWRDEARSLVLTRAATRLPTDLAGPVHPAAEGDDMTARHSGDRRRDHRLGPFPCQAAGAGSGRGRAG
ncbi:hypothetical protein HOY34_05055 [Xinfangfangia sp. D13-10-4-6]|uniref:hypothetical protein n=1 Tax=Pseudogemmobacter hezensis TaxID=2737662 RepID=UPI00155819BD|nr:hypothetical protein [Pseudogemmobacter hezensis]NPD14570.1 hypothetical protein [Pseudogemmobacter hezensis]